VIFLKQPDNFIGLFFLFESSENPNYSFTFSLSYAADDEPVMDILHLNTLSLIRGTARNSIIPVLTEQGIKIID
jgi:hypothetical protein